MSTHHKELLNPEGIPVISYSQPRKISRLYESLEADLLTYFRGAPTLVLQTRALEFTIAASRGGSPVAVVAGDGSESRSLLLHTLIATGADSIDASAYRAAVEHMNGLPGNRGTFLERYSTVMHIDALRHLSAARDWAQARYHRQDLGLVLYATVLAAAMKHMGNHAARRVIFSALPLPEFQGTLLEPEPEEFVTTASSLAKDARLVYAPLWRYGEHPDLAEPLLESVARMDALPNVSPSGRIPRSNPAVIARSVMGDDELWGEVLDSLIPSGGMLALPVAHLTAHARRVVLREARNERGAFTAVVEHEGVPLVLLAGKEQVVRQFLYMGTLARQAGIVIKQ